MSFKMAACTRVLRRFSAHPKNFRKLQMVRHQLIARKDMVPVTNGQCVRGYFEGLNKVTSHGVMLQSTCTTNTRATFMNHNSQHFSRLYSTYYPLSLSVLPSIYPKPQSFVLGVRFLPTLNQIRKQKPRTKKTKPKKIVPREKRILLGPQRRGVCVKTFIRKPKKPNSAQRKCALLRLSNGKTISAYIPGQKGNLQEHGVVLFRGGRVQDCPGIKYKIIRGKLDMN